jgi:YidC/Oxa1 family membrane protein insertase
MEKRTLLAIILSLAVLFLYQALVIKKFKPSQSRPKITQPLSVSKEEQTEPQQFQPQRTPTQEVAASQEIKQEIVSSNELNLYLSSEGAVINKILLKEEALPKKDKEFFLIEQGEARFAPLAIWLGADPQPTTQINHSLSIKDNTANFSANLAEGLTLYKNISFNKSKYGIELELIFNNFSNQDKELEYLIVGASNINRSNYMDPRFSGIESKVNGTVLWENQRRLKSAGGWVENRGVTEWVALRNTYYEVVLKPEKPVSASVARWLDRNSLASGLKIEQFVVPANSSVSHRYLLYAGPSAYKFLSAYNLEDTIYFGKLDFICKFLMKSLRFFFSITRNYGLAIIILTLAIGLVLFPLTRKNFRSMRQMQIIQPKISKLRELHKDSPHKLQREIMELYRKHNINPLGGCLPMFLQMPIFIALYMTLVRSFELKGATFLWIKDLSAPDAIFKLPFKLPFLGEQLNLLPILMIVAMVIQQRVSTYKRGKTDPQVEQQQKMMLMMPLLFGIIFYSLPSGLVLYWLVNTVFMILVQLHIARTMPPVEMVSG